VIDLNSEPWSREWLAKLLFESDERATERLMGRNYPARAWSLADDDERTLCFAAADAILAALPQHPVIRAVNAEWEALNKQGARPRTSRGSTGGPGTADKHGGGLV